MLVLEEVLHIGSRYQYAIAVLPFFHVVDELIVMRELEIEDVFPSICGFHHLLLLELAGEFHDLAVVHPISEERPSSSLGGYPDEIEHELHQPSDSEQEEQDIDHRLVFLLLRMREHILEDKGDSDDGPNDESHSVPEDASSDDPPDSPSYDGHAGNHDQIRILPEAFGVA